ncbi:MAG: cyclopropane-fatty-acyl-phospholipid synthase family protein [Terracidiphilus sp.]
MAVSALIHKAAVFDTVFHGYEGPPFSIRLWDGWQWSSHQHESPVCTIVVNSPDALASLVADPNELTLGEAFIHEEVDVEGDLFSVFQIAEHLFDRPHTVTQQLLEKWAGTAFEFSQRLRHGAENSERRDRASIAYHYDLPVAFYRPWLGNTLVYSCAYFTRPQDPLDKAQEQKLDLICRKLRLQPGEHFLDIGCGWGSLVLHAGGCRHAHAEGITLSQEQAATGKRRISETGCGNRCSIQYKDYRELPNGEPRYDKIASVGMFEHVGLKNLPLYFSIAWQLLRPGGLFLNHAIARSETAPIRESSFIARYVFPDGHLVTLSEALHAAESQGFEVRDVENLREHYELTLRRWIVGLRQNEARLLELVPRTTYRIWLLYMAGSAAAFHRGAIGIYQSLLSRPKDGRSGLPLTRNDLYAPTTPNGRR